MNEPEQMSIPGCIPCASLQCEVLIDDAGSIVAIYLKALGPNSELLHLEGFPKGREELPEHVIERSAASWRRLIDRYVSPF